MFQNSECELQPSDRNREEEGLLIKTSVIKFNRVLISMSSFIQMFGSGN